MVVYFLVSTITIDASDRRLLMVEIQNPGVDHVLPLGVEFIFLVSFGST